MGEESNTYSRNFVDGVSPSSNKFSQSSSLDAPPLTALVREALEVQQISTITIKLFPLKCNFSVFFGI
jgi:hypothetical protein